MTGPELLREVGSRGGEVWANGELLELAFPDDFPANLIEDLKQRKTELLTHVRNQTEPSEQGVDLITRLRNGHEWLLDQHQRWQSDDPTSADDAEFSRVWNGWWELDRLLRADHGFKGCIYKPDGTCPDGFPCQGCADLAVPGVAAQLELTAAMPHA